LLTGAVRGAEYPLGEHCWFLLLRIAFTACLR
jgi:hypothetical protein